MDGDIGAGLGQGDGDGAADAVARPGHQRAGTLEISRHGGNPFDNRPLRTGTGHLRPAVAKPCTK